MSTRVATRFEIALNRLGKPGCEALYHHVGTSISGRMFCISECPYADTRPDCPHVKIGRQLQRHEVCMVSGGRNGGYFHYDFERCIEGRTGGCCAAQPMDDALWEQFRAWWKRKTGEVLHD